MQLSEEEEEKEALTCCNPAEINALRQEVHSVHKCNNGSIRIKTATIFLQSFGYFKEIYVVCIILNGQGTGDVTDFYVLIKHLRYLNLITFVGLVVSTSNLMKPPLRSR